ncbi:hypothetical protein [Marinibacterium profundimaris]|uniref:hypothetical protein n=1 Tax=Marinibacterium profundimaris TaxID=1679460 RepID=UPI00117D0B1D|nr:hypothetical protein [Marinibacterium profundimaris]
MGFPWGKSECCMPLKSNRIVPFSHRNAMLGEIGLESGPGQERSNMGYTVQDVLKAKDQGRVNSALGISLTIDPKQELPAIRKIKAGASERGRKSIILKGVPARSNEELGQALRLRRMMLLARHRNWVAWDKERKYIEQLLRSHDRIRLGQDDWTVHCAAELATLLMGANYPENPSGPLPHQRNRPTFCEETGLLWLFLNYIVELNPRRRRGTKPSPERLFKCILSTEVARKLKQPNGGNPYVLPNSRDVSDVWYVLFGESEPFDNIKKIIPQLIYYLSEFKFHHPTIRSCELYHYPKLEQALRHKYPVK